MDINKMDDFIYLKTKKVLDSFFDYLKPAFDIVKNQGVSLHSDSEKEILKDYNKDNLLYQINSTSLIMELFLVIELFIKTELFKSNECFLYRFLDKYPEEKKKENELLEKRNNEFDQLKIKMATSMKNGNMERYKNLINEFVVSIFDFRSSNEFISVSVSEALNRLINYLNWDIADEVLKKFNRLIYCRNEIIHFGNFNNLTIGVSSAQSIIHSLALGAKNESQKGFYKNFSQIPDEYAEQINYYNEIFQHIYLHEYWNKIIESSNDIYKKSLKDS
jgi:hypothetical protein